MRYIKNLRPITLLNSDYKVLEKCLANRLKPVLESIINEDQKGFMADRKIQGNIRRILDAVNFCEANDTPIAILSIDAEKAFDRIETDSLLKAMDYFGFGESFKRWTKLCFTDATAVVINNGYISQSFKVSRGVKQGGCCSAFYFLVLIETLANRLRNSELEGLDINGISKLLGQFADDLDLYLWGSRQNVKKAMKEIRSFENSSGMKINLTKSTIFKLGSSKDFDLGCGLTEANQINVLGVKILSYVDDLKVAQINFEETITKAKGILEQWKKRGLSLLGKVLVINTLIASLFIYKMSVLPLMPQKYIMQLNELMNSFLWNSKKPKIKLEILQIPKKYGGAGLVDFEAKDLSLKFAWVKYLQSDSFIKNIAEYYIHPILSEKVWSCNLHRDDVKYLEIQNSFWRHVLEAWCELNYTKYVPPDESVFQFLWLNSHIRICKKPVFYRKVYENGLERIIQLFTNEGKLKNAIEIANEFNVPVLMINSVLEAIPREWRMHTTITLPEEEPLAEKICAIPKPTAYFYKEIKKRYGAIGKCYQFWLKRLENIELEDIEEAFKNIYRFSNYTKLRSFQFRLLHNALIFNTTLYYWKMSDTKLCTNCNKEPENVLHFYWECEWVQELWAEVKNLIEQKFQIEIDLNPINIIFGKVVINRKSAANTIILIVKALLYTNRCLKIKTDIKYIERYIYTCEQYELYNAMRRNKTNVHYNKWLNDNSLDEYIGSMVGDGMDG